MPDYDYDFRCNFKVSGRELTAYLKIERPIHLGNDVMCDFCKKNPAQKQRDIIVIEIIADDKAPVSPTIQEKASEFIQKRMNHGRPYCDNCEDEHIVVELTIN